MRVPMILVFGLVVLISGSFISHAHAEAGELGEHELPNPSIAGQEIKRQTREIETAIELSNVEEQTTASHNERGIPQVPTDGINKKRHISFSIGSSADESGDVGAVPRSQDVSVPSSPDESSCGCEELSFTSKITVCFTNIIGELKTLMECAKVSLMNLKSEISLGPQKDECLDDNAAAANASLMMTRHEVENFMDRLPALMQVVANEPEQLWSIGDVLSSSVPTNKISCCVSNLCDHVLELLGVIKEWLRTNDRARQKIQVIENQMTSLRASKFDSLDVYSPSSSLTVSPSVSIRPAVLTNRRDLVNWPEQLSGRNELIITKKLKTIRSLCNFIRQVPILLIELITVLKYSLSTIHENSGLGEKLRNHPLFLLLASGGLLPDREGTTVNDQELFYPDPKLKPFEFSPGEDDHIPTLMSSASLSSFPTSSIHGFSSPPVIPIGPDTITRSAQISSIPERPFSYPDTFNSGFPQPQMIVTGPGTTNYVLCTPTVTWSCSPSGSSSYKDEHQAVSLMRADTTDFAPASWTFEDKAHYVSPPLNPTIEYMRPAAPWTFKDTDPSDCSSELFNAAAAKFKKVTQDVSDAAKSWIPAMMDKKVSLASSLSGDASLAIPSGKISASMRTNPPSGSSDLSLRSSSHSLFNKFGNGGCCLCKQKNQLSSSGTPYASEFPRSPNSRRSYRERILYNDQYARKRRYIPSYFLSSANSPSTRGASNSNSITPSSSGLPSFLPSLHKPSNIPAGIFLNSASGSSPNTDASDNNEEPTSSHFSKPSPSSTQSSTSPSSGHVKPATYNFNRPANDAGTPPATPSASGASSIPYEGFEFDDNSDESIHTTSL